MGCERVCGVEAHTCTRACDKGIQSCLKGTCNPPHPNKVPRDQVPDSPHHDWGRAERGSEHTSCHKITHARTCTGQGGSVAGRSTSNKEQ